jgi:hypothetical protein
MYEQDNFLVLHIETWDGRNEEQVAADIFELIRKAGYRVKAGMTITCEEHDALENNCTTS